jgi:hypothetical protein
MAAIATIVAYAFGQNMSMTPFPATAAADALV